MSDDESDKTDETASYEEFEFQREAEAGPARERGRAAGLASALAATLPGVALPIEATLAGALRPGAPDDRLRRAWERLWVACLQAPWTSLALVPAAPGMSTRGVAEAFVLVGGEYRGRAVELVDAHGLRMSAARALAERVGGVRERHALVVTLDCPLESQSALVVARAAAAALLVVPVGRTPLGEARRTIETVGRPRFIGAVALERGRE